jgi:ribose/xylose/arabinose/galactoside ABC-type transport system permease subunit
MEILRVNLVLTSTSFGRTLLAAGSNSTSSKVSATGMSLFL